MNWKLKEGIILTTVCGQSFLVRSDSARNGRISVININESAAFIYQKLRTGYSLEEISKVLPDEFEIPEGRDVGVMINEFIKSLEKQGYIVFVD